MDCYSNVKNENQKSKYPKAFVAIILGQAQLNCRRFGICKMKPIYEEEELHRMHFDCLAYLSLDKNGYPQLRFLQEWMTDKIYQKFFASGQFVMGQDYVIPEKIRLQIQCYSSLQILKGTYAIQGEVVRFVPQIQTAA